MSRYQEITETVAERITDVLERVQNAQLELIETLNDRFGRYQPEVPERLAELLPSPETVVKANYAFARRLLDSQRDYALRLAEALEPEAAEQPVAPSAPAAPEAH